MGPFDNAIDRLGIVLPPAPKPVASYVPYVRTGNLVYVSGQIAATAGQVQFSGPVGGPNGMNIEKGAEAAKLCVINALAVLRDACGGDLDQVQRIIRVGVWVQCADGFDQQAKVANGASDLLVSIFGEAGKHARAAVGANALPLNTTVEVELLVQVK